MTGDGDMMDSGVGAASTPGDGRRGVVEREERAARVVIVGRPNVGKSSLLNLLSRRRISIVDPTAGVTRDRVSVSVTLRPTKGEGFEREVELIDTGGYGVEDEQDLTSQIERQIESGLAAADLVLFVIDAQAGVVALDRAVAELLRSSDRRTPVMLVANKVDGPNYESMSYEGCELGFGEPVMISAANGYRRGELVDAVLERLPAPAALGGAGGDGVGGGVGDCGPLIAIVGKRNAGKSTLVNALAGSERVIVSEAAGTTRDSVDVLFRLKDRVFTAIDTAGVRKSKSLKGDIEFYSHHRTLRSVRRADVVLFLIDASVPISQVDKQLGQEIVKHHKPCVIVLNKWDLAEKEHKQEEYVDYLDQTLKGLSFAPVVFISAKEKRGMKDAVAMALNLTEQAAHRVPTGELNRVVEKIVSERGPRSPVGHYPKIYYVTQLEVSPPTIALFVNDPEVFDPTYQRYLMNRFRDLLPYSEVPIKLLIKPRRKMPEGVV